MHIITYTRESIAITCQAEHTNCSYMKAQRDIKRSTFLRHMHSRNWSISDKQPTPFLMPNIRAFQIWYLRVSRCFRLSKSIFITARSINVAENFYCKRRPNYSPTIRVSRLKQITSFTLRTMIRNHLVLIMTRTCVCLKYWTPILYIVP